jgi:hypothetical protein
VCYCIAVIVDDSHDIVFLCFETFCDYVCTFRNYDTRLWRYMIGVPKALVFHTIERYYASHSCKGWVFHAMVFRTRTHAIFCDHLCSFGDYDRQLWQYMIGLRNALVFHTVERNDASHPCKAWVFHTLVLH